MYFQVPEPFGRLGASSCQGRQTSNMETSADVETASSTVAYPRAADDTNILTEPRLFHEMIRSRS